MTRIDSWYNSHPGVWTLVAFGGSLILCIASVLWGDKWKRSLIDERQKKTKIRRVNDLKWKKGIIYLANYGDHYAFWAMLYDFLIFIRSAILVFICVRTTFAAVAAVQLTGSLGFVNGALVGLDKSLPLALEAVLAFTIWKLLAAIRLIDAIFADDTSISEIDKELRSLGVRPTSDSTENPASHP